MTTDTFKILDTVYKASNFTGELIDIQTKTETVISQTGGGGHIHNGTGTIPSVSISSQTTHENTLFLKDKNEKERSFSIPGSDLNMRIGHVVSIIWVIKEGRDSGSYVGIFNHNLNKTLYIPSGILSLWKDNVYYKKRCFPRVIYITLLFLAAFITLLGLLANDSHVLIGRVMFWGGIGMMYFSFLGATKLEKFFKSKIKPLITAEIDRIAASIRSSSNNLS